MKAIILAAGEGVRMRPLTIKKPKPLLLIEGRPLLYYLIDSFPETITEVVIVVGYLGHQIKRYCGEMFLGKKIRYVTQQDKKGTFHALKLCEPLLNDKESFAVFYADDLIDKKTVKNLVSHPLSITATKVSDPWRFGVVHLREDGKLKNIEEKPQHPSSNLVSASGFVLTKDILSYSPIKHSNGEYYLSSIISEFAKDRDIEVVHSSFWLPVGTPQDLNLAREMIKNRPEILS